MQAKKILLTSMPWASTVRPSLAIGILLANLKKEGINAGSYYPNLFLSSLLNPELYELISETPSLFPVAEHLFATDLFGKEILKSDEYLESLFNRLPNKKMADSFFRIRDQIIPVFLDYCVDRILESKWDVVGFSCTFNQVLPSLALANRLKKEHPSIHIIFGGACVHDEMGEEYARAFPHLIDAVFTGEADHLIVDYITNLQDKRIEYLPGITYEGKLVKAAVPFENLNLNEVPDYDDYFEERETLLDNEARLAPFKNIPFESSRGCWWGMKNHCTFCGLNNLGMSYRKKSTEKIINELLLLSGKYKCLDFMAADNILDFKAYQDLLPQLKNLALDLNLFYEIKANIRKRDIELLKNAGVYYVQPGIESFSTRPLKLMKKGVSALQNIEFIKWAKEYGIFVIYNILVGFYGEAVEDYDELINNIKKIRHLPPPSGESSFVEVHRFSPMFYNPPEFGLSALKPYDYMKNLYPEELVDYHKISYYFNNSVAPNEVIQAKVTELNMAIHEWINCSESWWAYLGNGYIKVVRNEARQIIIDKPVDVLLFIITDAIITYHSIEALASKYNFSQEELKNGLDYLLENDIILTDGNNYLNVIPYKIPRHGNELMQWFEQYFKKESVVCM